MSTQVDPSHNLAALLIGTGEFNFSKGALSPDDARAKGFLDFGNIVAFTPTLDTSKQEHVGSYRGVRRIDKTVVTENKFIYKLTCDEWNLENLRIMFGADDATGHTQPALSAVSGQAWDFLTTPAGIGRWYDVVTVALSKILTAVVASGGTGYAVNDILTVAGGTGTSATLRVTSVSSGAITGLAIVSAGAYTANPSSPNSATGGGGSGASITLTFGSLAPAGSRLRDLTTVTISSLTEGTDFVLDLKLGRIKFLTAQSVSRTPVITCAAIAAGDEGAFFGLTPGKSPVKSGYGNLILFDQHDANKVVLQHENFSCDVSIDSASAVDGTGFTDITMEVLVTGDVGEVLVREANQNSGVPAT